MKSASRRNRTRVQIMRIQLLVDLWLVLVLSPRWTQAWMTPLFQPTTGHIRRRVETTMKVSIIRRRVSRRRTAEPSSRRTMLMMMISMISDEKHPRPLRTRLSTSHRQQEKIQARRRRPSFWVPKARSVVAAAAGSTSTISEAHSDDFLTSSGPRPTLTLYNSRTRSKQPLEPVRPGHFSMYTCGPTVYDAAHVGNFRAFLTYDVLKRVLLYFGYTVLHVCNLTDVDDKILQRANQQGLSDIRELTTKFENLFMTDLQALNIVPAQVYPRATEHIDDMMEMIQILAKKQLAYETSDGSWYFRTQNWSRYGKQLVQKLSFEDLAGAEGGTEKEHFADFALWKAYRGVEEGGIDRPDAAWSSSQYRIRLGRPGWHLECSAMARRYCQTDDRPLDLHGGGIDLQFPHHENEIAQSEGILRPDDPAQAQQLFCNCWFHNGFVNLDNEKMSKSLGNFLTLQVACPTADDVRAYRYLVVSSQYRNPLSFTPEVMQASKNAIKRLDKVKADLERILGPQEPATLDAEEGDDATTGAASVLASEVVPEALRNFEEAIRDDLSMPRAAGSLFSLVKAAEQELKRLSKTDEPTSENMDRAGLQAIWLAMQKMDQIFGIFYQVPSSYGGGHLDASDEGGSLVAIPKEVLDLVAQRTAAKEAKDWALADSIRARITELGYAVKDVKGGDPVVSRLES